MPMIEGVTIPQEFRDALPTPDAQTWTDFKWPDWVPEEVRKQVEQFWFPEWGRGPQSWLQDSVIQGGVPLGTVVSLPTGFKSMAPLETGRFVHAWNNIARLVLPDGTFAYCSFYRDLLKNPEEYRQRCLMAINKQKADLEAQLASLRKQEEVMARGAQW